MLYSHRGEKQQTKRPKGSGPKRVRQAKKPTKRNPATSQKDRFKCIWLDKTCINEKTVIKKTCKKKSLWEFYPTRS